MGKKCLKTFLTCLWKIFNKSFFSSEASWQDWNNIFIYWNQGTATPQTSNIKYYISEFSSNIFRNHHIWFPESILQLVYILSELKYFLLRHTLRCCSYIESNWLFLKAVAVISWIEQPFHGVQQFFSGPASGGFQSRTPWKSLKLGP